MKDFIQSNFPELLLATILLILAAVLLFCIHWHADHAAEWAMTTITSVIVGLSTLINSIRQPKPNGTSTVTTTITPEPVPTKDKP